MNKIDELENNNNELLIKNNEKTSEYYNINLK